MSLSQSEHNFFKQLAGIVVSLSLTFLSVVGVSQPASAAPNTPTILGAAGGNGFIGVQASPAGTGTLATHLVVTASPGASTCTMPLPVNYCNLVGLTNGTKYTVSVVAVESGNESSPATTIASPRVAEYTLSVTDGLVDEPGECQTFTTNAPSSVLATWSGGDGVIGEVGTLAGYSLCPLWEWYPSKPHNLTLTLWHSGTPISVGQSLSTVELTYTPFASATGLYSPNTGGGGGGGGGGGEGSSTPMNYFVVEGFSKGKANLNKAMRGFIKKELAIESTPSHVVCIGTVRGKKWTDSREALALARATSGCNYVTKLYPQVGIKLNKRLISGKKKNPLTVRIRVF